MDNATAALSRYILEKGYAISSIAESIGVPYKSLWLSLSPKGKRDLRADEFLLVCRFIDKNPLEFMFDKKAS